MMKINEKTVLLAFALMALILRMTTGIEWFSELFFLIMGAYFGMIFKKQ